MFAVRLQGVSPELLTKKREVRDELVNMAARLEVPAMRTDMPV
jgi:hypothetical protein